MSISGLSPYENLIILGGMLMYLVYAKATNKQLLFFLLFALPIPAFIESSLHFMLQHASSWVACALLYLSQTPFYYDSLVFTLPSIQFDVAPGCSGLRPTLMLILLTAFLLRNYPAKIIYWAIPITVLLGILRNGARIWSIGQSCEILGPSQINGWMHNEAGPLFFAISTIPLIFFLTTRSKLEKVTP